MRNGYSKWWERKQKKKKTETDTKFIFLKNFKVEN